ncbi:hypothetical protein PROFUN_08365 [Planoprotostelium fungivorum]|uniref:Uncharacterized protein n=1 Tax=Planoprotostelium fungivorum TaxID=1890364 RepID=A0A2P6NJN2_9EUKA|nr:hypothetical protein PROFUN_08365 [Planoprotostelium fungivorum]
MLLSPRREITLENHQKINKHQTGEKVKQLFYFLVFKTTIWGVSLLSVLSAMSPPKISEPLVGRKNHPGVQQVEISKRGMLLLISHELNAGESKPLDEPFYAPVVSLSYQQVSTSHSVLKPLSSPEVVLICICIHLSLNRAEDHMVALTRRELEDLLLQGTQRSSSENLESADHSYKPKSAGELVL